MLNMPIGTTTFAYQQSLNNGGRAAGTGTGGNPFEGDDGGGGKPKPKQPSKYSTVESHIKALASMASSDDVNNWLNIYVKRKDITEAEAEKLAELYL